MRPLRVKRWTGEFTISPYKAQLIQRRNLKLNLKQTREAGLNERYLTMWGRGTPTGKLEFSLPATVGVPGVQHTDLVGQLVLECFLIPTRLYLPQAGTRNFLSEPITLIFQVEVHCSGRWMRPLMVLTKTPESNAMLRESWRLTMRLVGNTAS